MERDSKCGVCGIYPNWLQNFATSRSFIVVYGLLGTVQSMAFIYMVVSLMTLEKRFKISSQTTGIILSGNEISEVLSILLIYYGASAHRPRWIAIGVGFSAVSCLILALPHFIYGPGQDALALTQEYLNSTISTIGISEKNELPVCSRTGRVDNCQNDNMTDTSVVPKLFVFFSQVVLGIGTTLYYGLGQPYMDDNAKKKNVPMMFGITFALRCFGPAISFVFSFFFMNLYIDPTLHPVIEKTDPRWLGAWWLGWIILAFMQGLLALLVSLFPQELRNSKHLKNRKTIINESEAPLKIEASEKNIQKNQPEKPTFKKFPSTTKQVVTNKLLMINVFGAVFDVLSYAPFLSFFAKYVEVQFNTSSAGGTIISGKIFTFFSYCLVHTLMGMVLLISGFLISKFKPSPRPLILWNILVGLSFVAGQIVFMFISCDTKNIKGLDLDNMTLNLMSSCNEACNCDQVKFSPVCHEPSGTTFFSACHTGCQKVTSDTVFGDCHCISSLYAISQHINFESTFSEIRQQSSNTLKDSVTAGPCQQNCFKPYIIFSIASTIINILSCSGRIGTFLITYRCVETRHKGLAQGIGMMSVSLLALIPGPIIYGAIVDSTCLVWDYSCKKKGNCWVYDKNKFRYYTNAANACFSMIAIFLGMLVWYYAKDFHLYGEQEETVQQRLPNLKDNKNTTNDEETNFNL